MRRFAPRFPILTILPLLAVGTKVGTALGDRHPPHEGPAGGTRFAGALIDAVADLEKSFAPFGIDVIGDGRPSGGDGLGEHGDDGVVEFAAPVAPYALGERSEERRVGKECRSRWSP